MKRKARRFALLILSWPFRLLWWPYHLVDQFFRIAAVWAEKFGFFRFLRSLEAIAIAAALVVFWLDLQDRQADRDNRAWSLIAAVSGNKNIGNVGVGNALEILNNDSVGLDEIHLPGAWLLGTDLQGAFLSEADFSGATLSGANLSEAVLLIADLSGATLSGANLSGADLSEAMLGEADLSGADITGAIFSNTAVSSVMGLTQAQIDSACYSKKVGEVILPAGFRQPPECPEKAENVEEGEERY